MRSDALTMTLLYDYYGELLTEKQRGLFDLYYNQDYSLSEIASAAGISRQGVHDTLARAEELLEGYEAALGCIALGSGVKVEDINKLLKQFDMMNQMMKQFSGPGASRKMKRMGKLGGMGGLGGFPGL